MKGIEIRRSGASPPSASEKAGIYGKAPQISFLSNQQGTGRRRLGEERPGDLDKGEEWAARDHKSQGVDAKSFSSWRGEPQKPGESP